MAILRKQNKNKFTSISNDTLSDPNLTLKDVGLLVRLLSLPDNWEFSENGLEKIFLKDGRDSIRTGLKHLEEYGFLHRYKERDKNGRILGVVWELYEVSTGINYTEKPAVENPTLGKPTLDSPLLGNPTLVNPSLEKPRLGNLPQLNTNILNTKLLNTKELNTKETKDLNNNKNKHTSIQRMDNDSLSENNDWNNDSSEKSTKKEPAPNRTDQITKINNNKGNDSTNKNVSQEKLHQEFEEVWKLYPNKQGKAAALKAYVKARKESITKEEIVEGLNRYKAYIRFKKIETRYIKHGSTWFNQRCWYDDYEFVQNLGILPNEQGTEDFLEILKRQIIEEGKNMPGDKRAADYLAKIEALKEGRGMDFE